MGDLQDQYDDAMFDFSMGRYDEAVAKLEAIREADHDHFEAQLALGMVYFRKGDIGRAILEGHKAEGLRPKEQLVHTNLSLFYAAAGEKAKAEHHGLQARIASWRENPAAEPRVEDPDLQTARPVPPPVNFPPMPWKKKQT